LFFYLDVKEPKDQGFIKISCVSNPEVSARNTRHERLLQSQAFVVAVYCYAHAIRTYLLQEPLTYFSNAGSAKITFSYGIIVEQRFGS